MKARRPTFRFITLPRFRTSSAVIVVALLTAVALIIFSPLALQILDDDGRDWEKLSLIGQSYGAISAVLAAAAVVAVALTLILQQRQVRDARRLAIRQFHTELLAMAIDDPQLLQAWGQFDRPDGIEPRLVVYTNLVLNYFLLLHQTGSATQEEVRLHLRFMATSEWARAYWASTADVWAAAYPGKSSEIIGLFAEELGAAGTSPG